MVTFINVNPSILENLLNYGFKKEPIRSPYELFRLSGICYIIYFTSKKLLLQGKKETISEVAKLIASLGYKEDKSEKKNSFESENYKVIFDKNNKILDDIEIGSDEVLKGDTFGGIVVVGILCNSSEREKLQKIGVTDSKNLTDFMIGEIAQKIKSILSPDQISVKNVFPREYNENISKYKVTGFLNKLHGFVHDEIDANNKFKIDGKKVIHVTDKYPGCIVKGIVEEKAESKYISVAAASIIARNAGLMQLDNLSDILKYRVPKGSTHVKDALEYLKKSGRKPEEFVKVDFKNVKEFF